MPSSSLAAPLDVELRPDRPAMLRVDPPQDAAAWAAEYRDALRAQVTEHGALLVRGLGLKDPDQVGAVFARLAGELLPEREAFAPGRRTERGCTPPRPGRPTSRCACTTS